MGNKLGAELGEDAEHLNSSAQLHAHFAQLSHAVNEAVRRDRVEQKVDRLRNVAASHPWSGVDRLRNVAASHAWSGVVNHVLPTPLGPPTPPIHPVAPLPVPVGTVNYSGLFHSAAHEAKHFAGFHKPDAKLEGASESETPSILIDPAEGQVHVQRLLRSMDSALQKFDFTAIKAWTAALRDVMIRTGCITRRSFVVGEALRSTWRGGSRFYDAKVEKVYGGGKYFIRYYDDYTADICDDEIEQTESKPFFICRAPPSGKNDMTFGIEDDFVHVNVLLERLRMKILLGTLPSNSFLTWLDFTRRDATQIVNAAMEHLQSLPSMENFTTRIQSAVLSHPDNLHYEPAGRFHFSDIQIKASVAEKHLHWILQQCRRRNLSTQSVQSVLDDTVTLFYPLPNARGDGSLAHVPKHLRVHIIHFLDGFSLCIVHQLSKSFACLDLDAMWINLLARDYPRAFRTLPLKQRMSVKFKHAYMREWIKQKGTPVRCPHCRCLNVHGYAACSSCESRVRAKATSGWNCARCTFENANLVDECDICGMDREPTDSWKKPPSDDGSGDAEKENGEEEENNDDNDDGDDNDNDNDEGEGDDDEAEDQ